MRAAEAPRRQMLFCPTEQTRLSTPIQKALRQQHLATVHGVVFALFAVPTPRPAARTIPPPDRTARPASWRDGPRGRHRAATICPATSAGVQAGTLPPPPRARRRGE